MKIIKSLRQQIRESFLISSIAFFITFLILLSIYLFSKYANIPLSDLTKDTCAVTSSPFYNGLLSQLGLFVWISSATICFFSVHIYSKNSKTRNFLFFSGILTLVLGIDDAFLMHEYIFPVIFGIPEVIVLLIYCFALLYYLIRYLKIILHTDFIILTLALAFFGSSILIDHFIFTSFTLLEDGAKFIGVVFWLVYFIRVAAISKNEVAEI